MVLVGPHPSLRLRSLWETAGIGTVVVMELEAVVVQYVIAVLAGNKANVVA